MIPSDQSCGRCGGSLYRRTLRDAPLLVCPTCRTVTLDQADFQHLCVVSADLDLPPPEPTGPRAIPVDGREQKRTGRISWVPVVLGGSLLVVGMAAVVAVTLVVVARPTSGVPATIVRPREIDAGPVLPRVRADTPLPIPEPAPVPTSAVPSTPPTPRPVAPPSSPRPASPSSGSLIEQGWAVVDADPARASGLFEQALRGSPNHPDANYGYGYALLALGRPLDARPYLCRALPAADVTTQREIRALSAKHQLTCN